MATRAEDVEKRSPTHERAFEELFRSYYPVIVSAAYNRLSRLDDAEDVAAEVFSIAWRNRSQSSSVYTLAWLYGTLRNVVGNEYRRRDRAARRVEKLANTAADPISDPTMSDEGREVRRVVARLEPADRELIWMAYWEDLTREEMAEILGCTHATVRVRLFRARRRLKVALEAYDTDLASEQPS